MVQSHIYGRQTSIGRRAEPSLEVCDGGPSEVSRLEDCKEGWPQNNLEECYICKELD